MVLLVGFFVICASANAWAGATVSGCASSSQPIATPHEVARAASDTANSINSVLMDVGKTISGNQKKTMTTINENFKNQNNILKDLLTGLGMADEKMKNQREFGSPSMAYLMTDAEYAEYGKSVYTGKKAAQELSGKFTNFFEEHIKKTKTPKKLFEKSKNKAEDYITSEYFFPKSGTLTPEQLHYARYMLANIIDPFPSYGLPEKMNSRQAKEYRAMRKIKYSRLAMPVTVLSEIISAYAPTMESQNLIQNTQKAMGASATDGVYDGKISTMKYIEHMTDLRFANNDWLTGENGIHAMTQTGLLREMLVMQSVEMEMQRRQMKRMQQMAALLAQDQAMETGKEFNDVLKMMRNNILKN